MGCGLLPWPGLICQTSLNVLQWWWQIPRGLQKIFIENIVLANSGVMKGLLTNLRLKKDGAGWEQGVLSK